jgi:hypothetical protein
MILILAEKYGQSPQEVEQWDEYWLERAALKAAGESLHYDREAKSRSRK